MSRQEARKLGREMEAAGFRFLGIMTNKYTCWVEVIDPRTNTQFFVYSREQWQQIKQAATH